MGRSPRKNVRTGQTFLRGAILAYQATAIDAGHRTTVVISRNARVARHRTNSARAITAVVGTIVIRSTATKARVGSLVSDALTIRFDRTRTAKARGARLT